MAFSAFLNRSGKQRYTFVKFVKVALLIFLLVASYDFVIGFPRPFDGQWVQRRTIWHLIGLGCPIPYQRGTIYTFYRDAQGEEIYHGPFRRLHGNGVVSYYATYRHGKLDGLVTGWDPHGLKTNETIYRDGQILGWAGYLKGKLHYHNEKLLENDRLTAWKRFENGRWFLERPAGEPPIWQIDTSTGELSRVK